MLDNLPGCREILPSEVMPRELEESAGRSAKIIDRPPDEITRPLSVADGRAYARRGSPPRR